MVELLVVAADAPDERAVATRFGGRPLVVAGADFVWPVCAECALHPPMQFLGQIAVPADTKESGEIALLLLFMCAGGDGCATWEADGGANRVFVMPGGSAFDLVAPPVTGETTLRHGDFYGAERVRLPDADDYDAAREAWAVANGRTPRDVLGQYGGAPEWLQGNQTPLCSCGETMAFVAQLEEGPDDDAAMNFGGGCAYVFRCGDHAAKLLWQQ